MVPVFLVMRIGVSRPVAVTISTVIVAAVIITAFVLFSMPPPGTTTTSSSSSNNSSSSSTSSTSSSSSQTTTTTKLVYTDITSGANLSVSISANEGEVFIVHLAANTASTGYDWNVSTSSGIHYIGYTTTSVGTLVGAPSERDYRFQAVTPGDATITLVYGRFPPAFSVTQIAETIQMDVEITA